MADFPFIGRQSALNAFHSLLSLRAQKSVLYLEAIGGLGKTWLLKEYLKQSLENPRWYLCPPGFDTSHIDSLIIDFYQIKNRSIDGLIVSIIERLGWEYFQDYKENLEEITGLLEKSKNSGTDDYSSSIAAFRRKSEELFFRDFKNAIRSIDGYVLLVFDTFEVAHRRRVGRWFLDKFLSHQATADCIVVFAGRPPTPQALPYRVIPQKLDPWEKSETISYLTQRWPKDFSEIDAERIHQATNGHPLLIDMVVYTRNAGLASLEELSTTSRTSLEWSLIDRFARNPVGEHSAIIELGYLKRRFDPEIFSIRQNGKSPAYDGIESFDKLIEILRYDKSRAREGLNSITKYRLEDRVLSLHDEVQRMISEHAYRRNEVSPGTRDEWKKLCKELYEEIVDKWYKNNIKEESSEEKKNLLKAEQLGYELDADVDKGLVIYNGYFNEIKKNDLSTSLAFNELIWGEVIDQLEDDEKKHLFVGKEYKLCNGQADWLWLIGQFDAAADIYQTIIDKYTLEPDDAIRRLDALASIGHAHMQLGRYERANDAFEIGLELAFQVGDKKWISAFQQNKGQLLQLLNQWNDAEKYFEDAVETSRPLTDDKEAQALPSLYLGSLQALLGKYDEAIMNCERGLSFRRAALKAPVSVEVDGLENFKPLLGGGYYSSEGSKIRLGIAYLKLAEVFRYSGKKNWEKSKVNYNKALEIFSVTNQHRYKSDVFQGVGNILYEECRAEKDYKQKLALASQSFEYYENAITLCRDYYLEQQIPKALHRLGHLIFEIGADAYLLKQKKLLKNVSGFVLSEEEAWLDSGKLRESVSFSELDEIGKAQRLFEISSLEAERMGDLNASLDSLVEASRIALYRNRPNDIRTYARLAQVPSKAYQQDLFLALINLILADLDINEGRYEQAIKGYAENFPLIVKSGGFGRYLLDEYLFALKQKLDLMSPEDGLYWCDSLIESWTNAGLHKTSPELISRMWEYRHIIEERIT